MKVSYLMALVAAYYFLQGMGGNPGLYEQTLDRFLKETLALNEAQQAVFLFFMTIPWMIKPLYGIVSDAVPLLGYRRRSYFILGASVSVTAYLAIEFFGHSANAILALMVVAGAGFAMSDVLCDAVMVERGKPLGATDKLQAAQWAALAGAGILVAFTGGYISEYFSFFQAVQISAVFPALVILVTIFFLREERQHSTRDAARSALRGLKEAVTSRTIWGCALFLFLYASSPGIGTALYNYQRDILKFSQIDIGYLRTIGNVALFAGVLIFGKLSGKISERALPLVVVASSVITTLPYLLYRDFASGLAISAFAAVVGAVPFMGTLVLAARVCPQHAEGTVFALLMAVFNLGKSSANIVGSALYMRVGYPALIIIASLASAALLLFIPLVRPRLVHQNPM